MNATAQNLLEVRGVKKAYPSDSGQLEVLRSVDLALQAGDRVAILGKSGAGKSTLLHILGTLEAPSGGSVRFNGVDIFSFSESRLAQFRNSELGFVFQFHYLMLEFTALENVMMPLLIAKRPRGEAQKEASHILGRVGLKDRLSHKPSQLSGGEQQRVAIARALVSRPKLLLTDEMTGNLDAQTGREVFGLIQELHQELGMGLISVTHDEVMAATYPRSYRLHDGVLQSVSHFA